MNNWIVGICSSACDGVILYRVTGTEEQVKKHLLDLTKEDKLNNIEDWEHGTDLLSEVDYDERGSLYAYGCYHDYHIDYSARIEEEPEVL